jgi:hypothetical protein
MNICKKTLRLLSSPYRSSSSLSPPAELLCGGAPASGARARRQQHSNAWGTCPTVDVVMLSRLVWEHARRRRSSVRWSSSPAGRGHNGWGAGRKSLEGRVRRMHPPAVTCSAPWLLHRKARWSSPRPRVVELARAVAIAVIELKVNGRWSGHHPCSSVASERPALHILGLRDPHPGPTREGPAPHGSSSGARERCVREREERDKEVLYGEEDKNLRVFLHMCMTTEGVWTQVAQHNKFGVLDFDFASLWT